MAARVARLLPASLLILALLVPAGLGAEAASAASSGDQPAAVSKKKKKKRCTKKKRKRGRSAIDSRRKKCSKKRKKGGTLPGGGGDGQTQDPVKRFTEALAGAKLERVYSNSNQTSSGSERYNFCSDGTFSYHGESFTQSSSSVTDAQGTWKIASAAFNSQGTAAEGKVPYTSNNSDFPAGEATVTLVGNNQAYIGETEFQRTAGGAGC